MNLVYIFDDDVRKRAEIAFRMNNLGVHAIPCESISEISSQYDLRSFIFAHDQSNNIGTLIADLEALQTWQPVIAFCERPDPRRVVKAIKAGAVEYVDTCDYVEGWLEVIAELNSDPAFNRQARMAAHHVQAKSKIEKLTSRETEILYQGALISTHVPIGAFRWT